MGLSFISNHINLELYTRPLDCCIAIKRIIFKKNIEIITLLPKFHLHIRDIHSNNKTLSWEMLYLFWVWNQNGGGTYFGYI